MKSETTATAESTTRDMPEYIIKEYSTPLFLRYTYYTMRRWLVVCACVVGVLAGGLVSYLVTAEERNRSKNVRQFTAPEEPTHTVIVGTVISVNSTASYFTVEAVSPHNPQEKVLLQIGVSGNTEFAVRASPIAAVETPAILQKTEPVLSDLRPGMSVSMEIERQSGPLKASNVIMIR